MTDVDRLTLELSEPLASEVRRAVERGDYPEPADVIAAALDVWIERGSPPAMTDHRLRELVVEADQAGKEPDEDFNIDAVLNEARRSGASKR